MLRGFNRAAQQAQLHQECGICYDDLSRAPVSLICDFSNRPVCTHEYHTHCIQNQHLPGQCRFCGKQYNRIAPIIKITQQHPASPASPASPINPHQCNDWFDCLDVDKNGYLTYEEIIEGLKAQVMLDWRRVEADVDRLWRQWDRNGDMTICREEFSRPHDGLFAYLLQNYSAKPRPPPPDIRQNKTAWFQYWDEDQSRSLSKEEIARALVKTFRLYSIPQDAVINVLEMIWPIFDSDNSGMIEMHEFVARDNLADTIIAQLQQL